MYAGEWEQRISWGANGKRIAMRDSNAFTTAVIIGYLGNFSPDNTGALALSRGQLERASSVRSSAVKSLEHFRYTANTPAFGSYGYWPRYQKRPWKWVKVSKFLDKYPRIDLRWLGDLEPLSARIYLPSFRIWPDSDTTAACYNALLISRKYDGEMELGNKIKFDLFARYRDRVDTKIYAPDTCIYKSGSGAFLTWWPSASNPDCPNEVDIVVNANVLAFLGKYQRLPCVFLLIFQNYKAIIGAMRLPWQHRLRTKA